MSANAQKNFKWNVKWQIVERVPAYKLGDKDCKLCISEKYHILIEDDIKAWTYNQKYYPSVDIKLSGNLANFFHELNPPIPLNSGFGGTKQIFFPLVIKIPPLCGP